MAEQVQKHASVKERESSIIEDLPERQRADLSQTDDLVDAIDAILEDESIATNYKQKGGQ